MDEKAKGKDLWLKVFCPNACCLTGEKVAGLSKEKRNMGADPTS